MEGIELQVKISDLLIADDPTKPNCDSVARSSIAGTSIKMLIFRYP